MPKLFPYYVLFLLFGVSAFAQSMEALAPEDGVPWKFSAPERTVAIGDLHADPDAMLQILEFTRLIDGTGNWIGGKTHLVVTGDILDRGPDSRFCLDFLFRLRAQAKISGGLVHLLLGNHELMVASGHRRPFISPGDAFGYHDFFPNAGIAGGTHGFFRSMVLPQSPYAEDLRWRNSMVQIGNTLFVHGGIGEWLRNPSADRIGRLNATVRKQITEWQNYFALGIEPGDEFDFLFKYSGPFWTRGLGDRMMEAKTVHELLDGLKVLRVVVGHTPTRSSRIEGNYDGRSVVIDTGISRAFSEGKLSALEIDANGEAFAYNDIPRLPLNDSHPVRSLLEPEFLSRRQSCAKQLADFPFQALDK